MLEDESTLLEPPMTECIRETMYAAEFQAPRAGGVVVVRYPFEFRPDDEQAPAAAQ